MQMSKMREKSYKICIGRQDEYARAKSILNAGRHPTFIGRTMVERCAVNGGLIFLQIDDEDAAVVLINPRRNVLLVLNVIPKFRSLGVGKYLIDFLKPNFARVVESACSWFERNGYKKIGDLKPGRSLNTQVMVRENIIGLSGRIRRVLSQSQS